MVVSTRSRTSGGTSLRRFLAKCSFIIAFLAATINIFYSVHSVQQDNHPFGTHYWWDDTSRMFGGILPHDSTTFLKRRPRSLTGLNEICHVRPGHGVEGIWGYQGLVKIRLAANDEDATSSFPVGVSRESLLCLVITDSTRHTGALQAIMETYAPHCDGFLAFSNRTDPNLGAIDLWNIQPTTTTTNTTNPPSNTNTTTSDWRKVQRVWDYVYQNYRNEYDLFHLAQDDAYVIPQNIRYKLSRWGWKRRLPAAEYAKRHKQPLYVGSPTITSEDPKKLYCGGGAGYTLNRPALDLASTFRDCHSDSVASADQVFAQCMMERHQIKCAVLLGPNNEWFYHEYGMNHLANRESIQGGAPFFPKYLKRYHGIDKKTGVAGVAVYSTSFHLVDNRYLTNTNETITTADSMRRIHAILYRLCDDEWDRSMGALDARGKPGYIHDPYYVKNHPLPFQFHPTGDAQSVCAIPFGDGPEGTEGMKGLEKVTIINEIPTGYVRKRILCIVYTHSNRHDRVRAIIETYATRCDGFMAASNLTDPTLGAVHLLHEGPEACKCAHLISTRMWRCVCFCVCVCTYQLKVLLGDEQTQNSDTDLYMS